MDQPHVFPKASFCTNASVPVTISNSITIRFTRVDLSFSFVSLSTRISPRDHRIHGQSSERLLKGRGRIKQCESLLVVISERCIRVIQSLLSRRFSRVCLSLSQWCLDKTFWFVKQSGTPFRLNHALVTFSTRENSCLLSFTWSQCTDSYRDHKRQTYAERNWPFFVSVCPWFLSIPVRTVSTLIDLQDNHGRNS